MDVFMHLICKKSAYINELAVIFKKTKMRQLLIIILTTFLFADSFSQTKFSISVKDTLKYQFQFENYSYKVNIGSVNYGQQPTSYNFYITNNSDTPLVITQAYWAEPILAPTYKQDPIAKGRTGLIKYTLLETKRGGPFSKTGTVQTNLGTFSINFTGQNLPPFIYLDKPIKIDTIALGDTISSEFKIYNKSDTSSLTIENIQSDWKTIITYDTDEVKKYENIIPPNSYRTFKVLFIPYKIGTCSSKINIKLSDNSEKNQTQWNWKTVEYNIFATVRQPKKK